MHYLPGVFSLDGLRAAHRSRLSVHETCSSCAARSCNHCCNAQLEFYFHKHKEHTWPPKNRLAFVSGYLYLRRILAYLTVRHMFSIKMIKSGIASILDMRYVCIYLKFCIATLDNSTCYWKFAREDEEGWTFLKIFLASSDLPLRASKWNVPCWRGWRWRNWDVGITYKLRMFRLHTSTGTETPCAHQAHM